MLSSRSSLVACSQRWLSLIAGPACRWRAGKAKPGQCPWRAAQSRKPRVLSAALALAAASHSSMSAWRHCRSVVSRSPSQARKRAASLIEFRALAVRVR
jgi:hypothetical protein